MKLTIELVPQTAWYTNVRSNVTQQQWDIIRKKCYKNANYKCEICNGTGDTHPVECHEIWEYNDTTHTQTLTGLIALCPTCHKVKHAGLSCATGQTTIVINQLMKVNQITYDQAIHYIEESMEIWKTRSNHTWTCNIDYLSTYLTPPELTS